MPSKQYAHIEKKLQKLKKAYLLTSDNHLKLKLEKEIISLEAQLLLISKTKHSKNIIDNANVTVGGDLNIGDNIIINEILEKQPTPLSWKKWLLVFLCFIILLISLIKTLNYLLNHQNFSNNKNKPLLFTIKVRSELGKCLLKNEGKLVIDYGNNTQIAFINAQGNVDLYKVPRQLENKTIRITLDTKGYQAISIDSNYQLIQDSIIFFIRKSTQKKVINTKKNPIPIKPKTFHISSVSEESAKLLRGSLEKDSNWKISKKEIAAILIELSYSGTLSEIRNQYYSYSNGYVQIRVNNKLCCCEDIMYIDLKASRQGNLKHVLEKQLIKNINQLIILHLNDTIKQIKKCAA